MAVVMGVEIAYLLRRYYTGSAERAWLSRASSDAADEADRLPAPVPAIAEARTLEAGGSVVR